MAAIPSGEGIDFDPRTSRPCRSRQIFPDVRARHERYLGGAASRLSLVRSAPGRPVSWQASSSCRPPPSWKSKWASGSWNAKYRPKAIRCALGSMVCEGVRGPCAAVHRRRCDAMRETACARAPFRPRLSKRSHGHGTRFHHRDAQRARLRRNACSIAESLSAVTVASLAALAKALEPASRGAEPGSKTREGHVTGACK